MDGGRSLDIVELVGIVHDAFCDDGLLRVINVVFARWTLLIYCKQTKKRRKKMNVNEIPLSKADAFALGKKFPYPRYVANRRPDTGLPPRLNVIVMIASS